ncbi:MAG: 2,3-bisphosphoglycerate-independent phosphoglycerate mutase [bacterium]
MAMPVRSSRAKRVAVRRGGQDGAGQGSGPFVLAILDGWGIAPPGRGNAICLAGTPSLSALQKKFPSSRLMAHGRHVGLLPNQEGNSEAGHSNIGAGRIVHQDILYVTEAIKDGTFFKNSALREAVKHVRRNGSCLHVMGLLSNGNSAHSSPAHLYALLEMMRRERIRDVRLHLFTDGRDSSPHSALKLLQALNRHLSDGQRVASIMGRFYAMDRNKWWVRTQHAYNAIVCGRGVAAPDPATAVRRGYDRGETDEFLLPTVIVDARHRPIGPVDDGDSIVFFNLRSDRARQLAKTFVQKEFTRRNDGAFVRHKVVRDLRFVAMTDFGPDLDSIMTAFPSRDVKMGLTEVLGRNGMRQLYIAESEKFAHVTYFLNGGFSQIRFGEERMRIPSQFVPHHYLRPEMRARVITDEVVRRLRAGRDDFIALNFANADMVAHSGNIPATVEAVRCVDACLDTLAKEVLARDGTLAIVGDHGNAERMADRRTGEVITEHSTNPVPFVIIGKRLRRRRLRDGTLADVAPTILEVLGLPKPDEMTGHSLLS